MLYRHIISCDIAATSIYLMAGCGIALKWLLRFSLSLSLSLPLPPSLSLSLSPSLSLSLSPLCFEIGDSSAVSSLTKAEIEKRVKLYVEMEDPDIVVDLCQLHSGRASKFDIFWEECDKFLQEQVGLAVDERRHCQVTHMASAVSVQDLQEQVASRCPPSAPIPSRSWLSLQFWPKSIHAHSSIHYTGRFKVKYVYGAGSSVRKTMKMPIMLLLSFGINENLQ